MQKQDLNGYRTPLDVARRYRLGDIALNTEEIEELASKIVTDSALSTTSVNPVQNKVVTAALNNKASIAALQNKQDKLIAGANITIVDNVISSSGGGIVDLKTITTVPSTFSEGDKYYNANDDLIYTATSSSTWDTGETPETNLLYLNEVDNKLYRYYNNQMNLESVSITTAEVKNTKSNSTTDVYSAGFVNDLVKDVYSANEQVVGTWFGKPLYRKTISDTINITASTSMNAYNTPHNIANVDNIFIDEAHSYNIGSDNANYPINGEYISGGSILWASRCSATATNIVSQILYYANVSTDFVWTLLYTKTTD